MRESRPWRARRAPGQVGVPPWLPAEMRKMVCQRQFPTVERSRGMPATGGSALVGAMFIVFGAMSACTPALLAPGERGTTCGVAVDEQFEAIEVRANPVANPAAGALVGAGSAGLIALGIIALNPLAVIQGAAGAAAGVACGAAAAAHPQAEAQFREIVLTAERGALKRAIEAAIPSPGAECRNVPGVATAPPDTVVRVESVVLTMGCPVGRQAYYVAVKWRATSATTSKVLGESTTRCIQVSSLDVDAWSADAERARNEVNGALAKTGQRIAAELLGADKWTDCTFKADEPGESGPR